MMGPQLVGVDWLSRAHGLAGQGCRNLEISPAAASLGHGPTEPGRGIKGGFWAIGRDRGYHGEAGRAGKACWCSLGADRFFLFCFL